jgi:hypothetical protein
MPVISKEFFQDFRQSSNFKDSVDRRYIEHPFEKFDADNFRDTARTFSYIELCKRNILWGYYTFLPEALNELTVFVAKESTSPRSQQVVSAEWKYICLSSSAKKYFFMCEPVFRHERMMELAWFLDGSATR